MGNGLVVSVYLHLSGSLQLTAPFMSLPQDSCFVDLKRNLLLQSVVGLHIWKFYSCLYSIMGSVKGSTVMDRVLLPILGYGCELWDLDSRMNKLLVYTKHGGEDFEGGWFVNYLISYVNSRKFF